MQDMSLRCGQDIGRGVRFQGDVGREWWKIIEKIIEHNHRWWCRIGECAAVRTSVVEQDCRVVLDWSVRCGQDIRGGVGLQGDVGWEGQDIIERRIDKGRHGTDPWPTESYILPIVHTNFCKVWQICFFLSTVTTVITTVATVTVVTNVTTVKMSNVLPYCSNVFIESQLGK